MANRDALTAVKKSLAVYLKANMPSLQQALEDFPTPSENLKMPCLSIITGVVRTLNHVPYVIAKSAPSGPSNNRVSTVTRVVGQHEFTLQVDLWCAYRLKRGELFNEFYNAINKRVEPMGLDLALTDYYDQIASFYITGFEPVDDEASRQRQEYRFKIKLEGSVNQIIEKSEHIIESVENNTSVVTGDIPDDSQDESTTII